MKSKISTLNNNDHLHTATTILESQFESLYHKTTSEQQQPVNNSHKFGVPWMVVVHNFDCTGGPRYSRSFICGFAYSRSQNCLFQRTNPSISALHWSFYSRIRNSQSNISKNESTANNEGNLYIKDFVFSEHKKTNVFLQQSASCDEIQSAVSFAHRFTSKNKLVDHC